MKIFTKTMLSLVLAVTAVGGAKAQDPVGDKIYEKDWTTAGSYSMWNEGFTTGKSIGINNSSLEVVNGDAVDNWQVQYFVGDGIKLKKGANYIVRLGIKGSETGSLTCALGNWSISKNTGLNFTTDPQSVDVTINDIPANMDDAHIMLQSGAFEGTLNITSVKVFELEAVSTYGEAVGSSDYTNGATAGWVSDKTPKPTYSETDGMTITITEAAANYWDYQYSVVGGNVDTSVAYILRMTVKGTTAANVHSNFAQTVALTFPVTTDWQTVEITYGNPKETKWDGVLVQPGDYVGTLNIKSASLYPVVEGRLIEVGTAGYTTYSANKALKMRGVTAYTAKYNAGFVDLTPVTEVPAGAGVIIEAAADNYKVPVIESASPLSDNDLLVSDGSVTGDGSTIYALGKKNDVVGFYLVKSGQTVPAGKAYLNIPGGSRDFIGFSLGGETTGIDNAQLAAGNKADGAVYNLAGQRVSKPTRGLYIVNGKKVVVK